MFKEVTLGRTKTNVITGVVTATDENTFTVKVPARGAKMADGKYENTVTCVISKTDAKGNALPDFVVGQPFTGFVGQSAEDEGLYVADEVMASPKVRQFKNTVTNPQTSKSSVHTDALIIGTLSKSTQVIVNEEKKCVSVPFNQPDGEPSAFIIWKDNPKSAYGPHWADSKNKDGKTTPGLQTLANRLKSKLDGLKEGQVLLLTYCGRFEQGQKQADGSWKNIPCELTNKDGKEGYTLFATSEGTLGDAQRYAFVVDKQYAIKNTFTSQKPAMNTDYDFSEIGKGNAPAAPAAQAAAPAPAVEDNKSVAEEVADLSDEDILDDMLQASM